MFILKFIKVNVDLNNIFIRILLINIILNLITLINLTLIAGILPLIERKYLALIQRRVGPSVVGYKGRLQFIADALKMFLKGCLIPNKVNNFYFLFYPSLVLAICYLFWLNVYWDLNVTYFELEYNFVYMLILSVLINFFIILIGINSNNKYATLASMRAVLSLFCLELLLSLMFLNVYIYSNSFNFSYMFIIQQEYWLLSAFLLVLSNILIVTLLEINRAPFDLTEAESELISGFHVEYGAFFFGLFYLGEYFHLFFFSVVLTTIFTGFC